MATRQTDVSTSVIQIPATPTTPIIRNRREMRGFMIVWKYNYEKEIARYRHKVYKCIIAMLWNILTRYQGGV